VRELLRMDKRELPEPSLQALWKSLDEDGGGYMSAGEFGRFMRKGEAHSQMDHAREARRQLHRRLTSQKEVMNKQYDQLVGRDMNAKLAHVLPLVDDEMDKLSSFLNLRMSELRTMRHVGWFKFFKELDSDHSGRISYEELATGLREQLQLTEEILPEVKIQGMWKRLDDDASGFISAGEFIRFSKRGAHTTPAPEESSWAKAASEARSRVKESDEHFKRRAMQKSESNASAMAREAERLEALLRKSQAAGSPMGSPSLPKIGGGKGGSPHTAMPIDVDMARRGLAQLDRFHTTSGNLAAHLDAKRGK
jgi:Ca2+-binding EF-hand superfamily protein